MFLMRFLCHIIILLLLALSGCDVKDNDVRVMSFDQNWLFYRGDIEGGESVILDDSQWRRVCLPHDWSIENIPGTDSPFASDAITEVSGGFTIGGTGWYRKHFFIDKNARNKCVFIAFDGIYMDSDVWVNGHYVGGHVYGYTAFELDITNYVHIGEENIIAVRVKNEGVNSRWYTGSGIYRHTLLKITDPLHFENWGTFVTTPIITKKKAEIHVKSVLKNSQKRLGEDIVWAVQIIDEDGCIVAQKEQVIALNGSERIEVENVLELMSPQLWSIESPYLYKVINRVKQDNKIIDEEQKSIGIRTIKFSADKGFQLNGKSIKLKGGCIHHDNGLLGAKAFKRAEERKIELLKSAGFNALRLAHNPPSTELLDACDRLGMLVIDEAFDMWYYGHSKDDYSKYFSKFWKDDLSKMILRDRNHPSIIMWSIGNEIKNKENPEIVALSNEMSFFVKKLDTTRPVTAGVNSITNQTDDYLAPLDICGYNYGLERYELDHNRHPERIIYASESYASQIYDYWKGVEKHPYVIGDFIWTAFDYIGEASIGWCGYPLNKRIFPWNHAYCGDLDLSGQRRPQSYLRETLWNEAPVSYIVVGPPIPSFPLNPDKADWSIWDFPDVVTYWNFPGNEGAEIKVHVYSNCNQVELFLNNKSLGKQNNTLVQKNVLTWKVPYQEGTLKAIGINNGQKVNVATLKSAGKVENINLIADRNIIKADGNDLSYITLELVDKNGVRNQLAEELVEFSLEGDAVIEGVGNANPMSIESFVADRRKTWRGSNLIVIRAGNTPGKVILRAKVKGLPESNITITQIASSF